MDTRQWIEPPGASVGLLPPWAQLPPDVRLLATLRHALSSNGREKGPQHCRALLLTAPATG